MKALGIGISTAVGIGGDPINGSSFRDILEDFANDDETDAVLMIGEIGGPQEAEARAIRKRSHVKTGDCLYCWLISSKRPDDGATQARS